MQLMAITVGKYIILNVSIGYMYMLLLLLESIMEILYLSQEFTSPSGLAIPFQMQRHQFPVKLFFDLAILKVQGQTLSSVGIYHEKNECFHHGQLDGIMSSVGNSSGLSIITKGTLRNRRLAVNVIYTGIL